MTIAFVASGEEAAGGFVCWKDAFLLQQEGECTRVIDKKGTHI